MRYTLAKQAAARTNTQTYSVGLQVDPHVYGTQRAQLACFCVFSLSLWCVTRSPNALASLQSFAFLPCNLTAKLHTMLSALHRASWVTWLPKRSATTSPIFARMNCSCAIMLYTRRQDHLRGTPSHKDTRMQADYLWPKPIRMVLVFVARCSPATGAKRSV
jgi:hypothetical protein